MDERGRRYKDNSRFQTKSEQFQQELRERRIEITYFGALVVL
jgi:hypothetical protein